MVIMKAGQLWITLYIHICQIYIQLVDRAEHVMFSPYHNEELDLLPECTVLLHARIYWAWNFM